MHMFWSAITDFGDSAAMLPAAAALMLWLLANGQSRAASAWAGLFAAESALVAGTKIAFIGWGYGIAPLNFTGISGHSTLSSSVIPIACCLATQQASPGLRRAVTGMGFAAALLIGVSRVKLGMHSLSEVAAGCALGGAVALLFMRQAANSVRGPRIPASAMAGIMLAMLLLIHGNRAPSERLIQTIALQLSGRDTPYTRWEMRAAWRRADLAPPASTLSV